MSVILQFLSCANLTSVQSLAIMTVDWLWTGGSEREHMVTSETMRGEKGERGREREERGVRRERGEREGERGEERGEEGKGKEGGKGKGERRGREGGGRWIDGGCKMYKA